MEGSERLEKQPVQEWVSGVFPYLSYGIDLSPNYGAGQQSFQQLKLLKTHLSLLTRGTEKRGPIFSPLDLLHRNDRASGHIALVIELQLWWWHRQIEHQPLWPEELGR